MDGKVCVVTGANSGIGKVTARALAEQGATVVMACRSQERGSAAREELVSETGSDSLHLMLVDMESLDSIRAFADAFRDRFDRLDVLVNNAGVSLPTRETTEDGLERMFAINHVGYHATACLLADVLAETAESRVVNVSSEGHRIGTIDFDNLQGEQSFGALRQYCNTKLANIHFSNELARRLRDRRVTSNALHPGAVRTGFAQDEPGWFGVAVKLASPFLISAERGARTSIYLATSPEVADVTGSYFIRCKRRKPARKARDEAVDRALWERTVELTGIDLPA